MAKRYFPDDLTASERAAIHALARLAAIWPRSLKLFSASGTLTVVENDGENRLTEIGALPSFHRIINDGGDPDWVRDA